MDEAQRKLIREAALTNIRDKWKDPRCPVCGAQAWQIGNTMDALLRDQLLRPNRPGIQEVYSFVPVFCNSCGYTMLFNAVSLGVVEPSESDWDQQPVEKAKP